MTLHSVGWALVHSAWQAAALAALLALFLAFARRIRPGVRYAVALATLVATLLLPVGTVLWLGPLSPDESARGGVRRMEGAASGVLATRLSQPEVLVGALERPGASAGATVERGPLGPRLRAEVEAALPAIVLLWATGLLISAVRLGGGLLTVRRLVHRGSVPPSAALGALADRLAARLRIRGVRIRESASVHVPMVIGWARPLILVPAALVTGLTPAELEALVAHELAHVRRYDILANLLQRAIETVFFFHPAVWWISARVREERENCCDDLAVAVCGGDAATYASALLALEELRYPQFATALAASGAPLLRRVQRLVDGRAGRVELGVPWTIGSLGLLALFISAESAIGERNRQAHVTAAPRPTSSPPTAADTATPARIPVRPAGAAWRTIDGSTLPVRWQQALRAGAREGAAFWVGYAIAPPRDARYRVHFDDSVSIRVGGDRERGRVMWRADRTADVQVPGDPLPPLPGLADSTAVVILAGYEPGLEGLPRLTRMHVASAGLPARLGARPVFWLGGAADAESIGLLRELFVGAPKARQRDLVATVGVHADARAAVDVLGSWLGDGHRESVREEAARWLGCHPTPEALAALAMTARTVRDDDIVEQAIEALSELRIDAATDTLVSRARQPGSGERREAAVAGLGSRGPRAVPHLLALASEPGDPELQEEAVAALARAAADTSLHLVAQVALRHEHAPVR
ncbi:MAG TPA: M56 family metallopeptidase, partial [Gemmatimonadaceae bacterium]|nr:M56 family metallopeptidase [Gemmatimonadaceae bacterium]